MTSFIKYLLPPARGSKESFVSHFDDINIPDDLEIELGGEGRPDLPRPSPERSPSLSPSSKDIAFDISLQPPPQADEELEDEDGEDEERVVTSLRDIDINSPVVIPMSSSKTKESPWRGNAEQPLRRSFAGFPSGAEVKSSEDVTENENDSKRLFEEDETDQIIFSRVRHNRFEYVRSALDAGVSVRIVDDRGNSLLHVCAQNNLRKMAALVIRAGCPLNLRNKKGFTALDYCVKYSFFDMGDWLMKQGAYHGELFTTVASDRPLRRNSIR